jgi:serine/threonine-protein kinase
MGVVYRAIDRLLERPVALKLLRAGSGETSRRFLTEARLLARLDHPHIPRVFDAGHLGGRPFMALELVEGPSFSQAARELSLAERLRAVLGLLQALAAVHAAGLVHCDVKPGNVVLGRRRDGRMRPCLVDFGIAREAGSRDVEEDGSILGTPAYLSPEQAAGGAVDHRADLWAVGAVLYEVLAGEPPFGDGDSARLLRRVLAEEPRSLRELRPSLPAGLEAVVMRCLAKDPAARHPSAEALAADLEALLEAGALGPRPASAGPGFYPPPSPSPSTPPSVIDQGSSTASSSSGGSTALARATSRTVRPEAKASLAIAAAAS